MASLAITGSSMKTNATSFAKVSIGWAALLAGGIFIVTNAAASGNITSVKETRGLPYL